MQVDKRQRQKTIKKDKKQNNQKDVGGPHANRTELNDKVVVSCVLWEGGGRNICHVQMLIQFGRYFAYTVRFASLGSSFKVA